jgi:hypothetical protein
VGGGRRCGIADGRRRIGGRELSPSGDHSDRSIPLLKFAVLIYTEGIGTIDFQKVSTIGGGLGMGATGITSKVDKGVGEAMGKLRELDYDPAMTIIEKVSVDTCGFSRGAAAARYCVHRILNNEGSRLRLQGRLEAAGWEVDEVTVLAVGLFDTVAAHGVRHTNDTDELKLDAIRDAAAVLQLAAAEEYRSNFSLTNINSAGGKGRQVYLPGAHSDIGGGYVDGEGEERSLINGYAALDVATFLVERGWYRNTPGGGELRRIPLGDGSSMVRVSRESISHAYSYIPLRAMAKFLGTQGIPILPDLYSTYDPGPIPARTRIETCVSGGGGAVASDWEGIDPELAELRNRYLHISFHTGFGMGPRLVNEGSFLRPKHRPYRRVFDG